MLIIITYETEPIIITIITSKLKFQTNYYNPN